MAVYGGSPNLDARKEDSSNPGSHTTADGMLPFCFASQSVIPLCETLCKEAADSLLSFCLSDITSLLAVGF